MTVCLSVCSPALLAGLLVCFQGSLVFGFVLVSHSQRQNLDLGNKNLNVLGHVEEML